jgi:Spy/CpxP family protein refolding chaperone
MKKLLIVLSLMCLFLFGGVCGFAVAINLVKKSLNEENIVNQRINEETRRLQLTPEQLEKVKPAYDQLKNDLSEVKRETLRSIAQAVVTQTIELSKVLTPEQTDKLQKLSEERRVKFEKMVKP